MSDWKTLVSDLVAAYRRPGEEYQEFAIALDRKRPVVRWNELRSELADWPGRVRTEWVGGSDRSELRVELWESDGEHIVTEFVVVLADDEDDDDSDEAALLTVPEAAERLGMTTRNLRRLIAAGKVPAILTSPRRLYVPAKAVEDELEARELASELAYAIHGGEPAQHEFDGAASSAAVLRRAVQLAWRGEWQCADSEGWDVWGWTSRTRDHDQEWRVFVRRAE